MAPAACALAEIVAALCVAFGIFDMNNRRQGGFFTRPPLAGRFNVLENNHNELRRELVSHLNQRPNRAEVAIKLMHNGDKTTANVEVPPSAAMAAKLPPTVAMFGGSFGHTAALSHNCRQTAAKCSPRTFCFLDTL
ncbi:hypothetical protein K438DRAFT_1763816 [Mycena galopus ATCC 62051]|nr:hypothetical protein K438DRAFT_1763816 [Mycena galopus ATCC 62051]